MKTIYKYPLKVADMQIIELPPSSVPLTVQIQKGIPCLWAEVDTEDCVKQKIEFQTYRTGHPITDNLSEYLSTYQYVDLVFHVYYKWL